MVNYSNWNSASKWLFGLLTLGVGNILLKTVDNVGYGVSDAINQNKATQQAYKDTITSMGESDVLGTLSDVYNSSSDNAYRAYRNRPDMPDFSSDTDNPWQSWLNSKTGAGLTENEALKMGYQTWERLDAQSFNHNEAVDARMWEQYVANNKYQWETQSMQAAGINPAMAYGGGSLVPTAATGAAGNSSGQSAPSSSSTGSLIGLIDVLSTIMRLPSELKSINADIARSKADAVKAEQEGNAAMMNAITNRMNAGTQKGELGVHERQVAVQEAELDIKRSLADSDIKVNEETVRKLAEEVLNLREERTYISKYYDIAEKNANSQQKQAIAAMRQADAAVQNAATNDYLSTYQSDLVWAESVLAWANGEGQEIVNKYLDERQKQELANIGKEGLNLDAQFRLINAQRKLADAQTVKTYVNCATDVANSVSRFVGIGAISGGMSDFGKSLSSPNVRSPYISPDSGMLNNYNIVY